MKKINLVSLLSLCFWVCICCFPLTASAHHNGSHASDSITVISKSEFDSIASTNDLDDDDLDDDDEEWITDTDSSYSLFNLPKGEQIGNIVKAGVSVAIVLLVLLLGLPLLLTGLLLYFRYKAQKKRYELMEKALAAGQPLPSNFFDPSLPHHKGMRNTFLGLGLFFFLWLFTGSIGMGSIGLLVMFIGIGKWMAERKDSERNRDNAA